MQGAKCGRCDSAGCNDLQALPPTGNDATSIFVLGESAARRDFAQAKQGRDGSQSQAARVCRTLQLPLQTHGAMNLDRRGDWVPTAFDEAQARRG